MPANDTLFQTVIITAIRPEADGVKTFTVAPEDGKPIPYKAGQFITLVFTHHGREERRSYSISSSPETDASMCFTVKRVDNGAYSRLLVDKARPGDKLYTTGSAGIFTLPGSATGYEQVFFFAAGIGITPISSLIKTLLYTQPDKQAVLIYSNRVQAEAVFYEELNTLAVLFEDRFRVEFLYSTSFNLARARLNKELVPVLLGEYSTTEKEKMLFYLCGPFSYMRMVIFALEEQGIAQSQVRKENFNTNDRAVILTAPADKEPHEVTFKHGHDVISVTCQYPDTLLKAAKKNNIHLPYSCEVGRCGSCAAICTSGKVWHSYNEVLMDSDIAHGAILTCTGYPVGGDVVIEW